MKIKNTKLKGCVVIEPITYYDDRGYFLETFQEDRYSRLTHNKFCFVQDNFSRSFKNVLRGLHFQKNKPQGKLVRVVRGEIYDVAVDMRPESETFGDWESAILSEKNKFQFWLPPGFAHGFVVLSDIADLEYKCTDYYDPLDEESVLWNDHELNISWPVDNPILSDKDANAKKLQDLK